MFYRIDPDLMMAHGLTDGNVSALKEFSQALASQGTTLIYLPIPTKALGQPWQLPRMAGYLGYDQDVAATVYGESLDQLEGAGVRAVDARAALAAGSQVSPAFFGTDPRLTAHGARALARSVAAEIEATPGFVTLPKDQFQTSAGPKIKLPSAMRFDLQEHCQSPLPYPETPTIVMALGKAPGLLFDGAEAGAQIALVGTELTGEPVTGFAAQLQELTGLRVAQYSVYGGGAFAAISSYLTSASFRDKRPAYLVWEHPIWTQLAAHGDQPMRELIAAAGPECAIALPMDFDTKANVLRAEISTLDQARPHTLLLDTDGAQANSAKFSFMDANGLRRTRTIYRQVDQLLTGRFYMPMSGLWPEGAYSVEITLDAAPGSAPRLFACRKAEVN